MRIDYDRVSGALYMKLREGTYSHTEDFSERADVYLDVDAEGNVLGLEALSFEDLALAVEERGGKLEVPEHLDTATYEAAGGCTRPDEPDPEQVREAVASLKPDDRKALELLIEEGLNIADFAERLGVSVAEAQVTRRAAYQKLNDALRRRGPASGKAIPHRPAAG